MRRWVHYHHGRLCLAWRLWDVGLNTYLPTQHRPLTLGERIAWRLARRYPMP